MSTSDLGVRVGVGAIWRVHAIWIAAVVAVTAPGCKSVDCGEGTLARSGICVAAEESVGSATCGPFTQLAGDRCVPLFPPTECVGQTCPL